MKPSRFQQNLLEIERWIAGKEPVIPWNSWYSWRIRHQMQKIYAFENELVERQNNPLWLTNFESRRFSQNGEDGILAEILKRVGLSSGYLVEIGASDGSENCTRALVEDGWAGTWIEGSPDSAEAAAAAIKDKRVKVLNDFVTRENINDLIAQVDQIDLLVIDIDGNDWWVAQEILRKHSPKVVTVEYNSTMGMNNWVMPYNPDHVWKHDRWQGASLRAFTTLMKEYGLVLVGTDSCGVNAFFVRSEFSDQFLHVGDIKKHYTPPRYLLPFGHPWQVDETAIDELSEEESNLIGVSRIEVINPKTPANYLDAIIYIDNKSELTLHSAGPTPIHIAAWYGERTRESEEPHRFRLLWPVPPKTKRPAFVRLPIDKQGRSMNVSLVQEKVRWIDWDEAAFGWE